MLRFSSPRFLAVVAALLTAACSLLASTDNPAFYTLNLADPSVRAHMESQGAKIVNEGPGGTPCVRFILLNDRSAPPSALIASLPIDVGPLRGAKVSLTAKVRADGIQSISPERPLANYLGGKCQLALVSTEGGRRWIDAPALHGSFDWRETGLLGGIPDDITSLAIRIGLEKATGTLWLSDVRLRILRPKITRPAPTPETTAAVASARTTLRGVMSPQVYRERDFDDLAAWNVNVVRWQMYRSPGETKPYDTWLATELDDLDRALEGAARRGIRLAVDLHSPPGGRLPDRTMRMFVEKSHANHFVEIWKTIARRFQGRPGLWAYNLVNEPVQNRPSPAGLDDWLGLQIRAARAIREIDSITPIMIETDQWSSPESFAWLQPVDIPGIIYQAHMYWRGDYTHQGVRTDQGVADKKNLETTEVTYPGQVHGAPFDKDALRRYLQPIRDFQLATGSPIFIGEFSAVRWAPGAARYLDDLISIFEEYGWNWTYHAFREWDGWSVEHADLPRDRNRHPPATEPTDRLKVLRKWFDKNTTR